jgi:NAD(P)-dependent dehydrogenase (short-subunit alcohol dehydrogenase family)
MTERQRVAVVTGASSGIGKQLAKALVAQGWRVIGTGRDEARMAQAADEIAAAGDGSVEMLSADLSLMAGARKLVQDIAARTDRIDVLANNAGRMTDRLEMTSEGLEANFAGNHLGPFVLTEGLMPLLHSAAADAPAGSTRILMTASDASEMMGPLNLDDMQNLDGFNPGVAYCSSKQANVLFARALATRLAGTGIVAHAMAPGATDTPFFSHGPEETQAYTRDLPKLSVAQGADTLVWLATADEPGRSSGGYWEQRAPRAPNPQVDDAAAVARFWVESEKLVNSVG